MKKTYKRQKGQSMVEYTICALFLILALFSPFGGENKSVIDRLMEAIRQNHESTVYAIGAPVVGSSTH
jgi:hypothetical protein